MANEEHLAKLKEGGWAWREWRGKNPDANLDLISANLSNADLRWANLSNADLRGANLGGADLFGATLNRTNLTGANLGGANLGGAKLRGANLSWAKMRGANLSRADLTESNLRGTELQGSDLSRASLEYAALVGTDFRDAVLSRCSVYGISVWDLHLEGARQSSLVISPPNQTEIEVDNLQVAQFIYLLLNNREVRDVIDTITSKVVLILGRFTPERKSVLEAIRDTLRRHGRLPVLFDFQKPGSQTTQETISTLAHMSRFIIVDITDAKSVLQELAIIVPTSPSVVVQPLLLASQEEPGMWDFFRKFPWVLEPVRYTDQDALIAALDEKVIAPADARTLPAQSQLPKT